MEKVIEYDCLENDNSIKVCIDEEGELDELQIGCRYLREEGWSVIGCSDLRRALILVGYDIIKKM